MVVAAEDISAVDGDAKRGARVFNHQCAVCHSTIPGYHKEGPSLAGVVGRRAGAAPAFSHYKGLKGSDVIWTPQSLNGWLADPRAFLGGRDTPMTYQVTDPSDRVDLIAFLATLD